MMSNEFEKAFSDFLEQGEYDRAHQALFAMIRLAFMAGWQAAGGEEPVAHKIFEIISNGHDKK